MTLFNSIGFNPQDSVFVVLSDRKYFGVIVDTDIRLDRVKVNYSPDAKREKVDWFHKSFWEKVN